MNRFREQLEQKLLGLPGLSIAAWKDTELICLFYHGRDFAHFHGEDILDLRLSTKIIRDEQLDRSISAQIHPKRSKSSRWIGIQFTTEADVDKTVDLVKLACSDLR